ncbi:MAG: Oxygen-independent coproporphyrinogen III oxidase [candidate division WS6 bacterium GW2011_GWC2_36_7]|uniref:Heme chaperone HemW n=3 Tax=Candidatus Dojkabacteria TaxID=74243 RepID=A0A0G0FC83_9BACT|nr:MAG: Oxygen-independent coproporphyrinogen III oxidase [candidate division WS6 bacterium GW2011_GWC2_36_7]KKQ16818.1 MAG: Oxygen-independent coproporphyrinogen III oxidase [candidate division WS6 bacterium GW2011_GWF1_36_8]
MIPLNLYIHIPFCFAKCPYCAFFSCTNCEDTYEEYFKTLNKEILTKSKIYKDREIQTIYIGGGTPNLVPYKYIIECIENIKKSFQLSKSIEITIEQYPQYIRKESLEAYKAVGINRISIGLQATDDNQLQQLSRRYTYEEFLEKYNLVKKIGIKDIGIDLIFGYPNHTLNQWEKSLELVTVLDINHISCYSLEVEEETPYGKLNEKGKLNLPTEIVDREMYHYACDYLNKKGFKQYEISNFAKEGYECMHNLNFWHYQDYVGLGAGAYSRVENTKSHNPEDIQKYINGEWDIEKEDIKKEDERIERIMLGLRLNEGIKYDGKLFQKKYMIKVGENMILNINGKDMYNQVVEKII